MLTRRIPVFFLVFLLFFATARTAEAMHITEGILPFQWFVTWFAVSAPFVGIGMYQVKRKKKTIPGYLPMVGLLGAAVFVFSCFPIPVIALSGMATSHPCGTGMSAVLLGPFVSVLVAAIALLIQALFLAHGGLTTLGGNVFSMGILGSFSGYFAFKMAQRCRLPLFWCGFLAGMISDIFTYLGTSLELGLLVINGGGSFVKATTEIFAAFMMTSQGILCLVEGAVVGFVMVFIYKRRPGILLNLGVIKNDAKSMGT
ncbi:MAG: energy-coupling factor ABC transporter permease [Candidatus Brocadiaceae bacterium]|nr:energy-coupling factor ABC transporter permease [Candidatus Brocadiaceae bacterium]